MTERHRGWEVVTCQASSSRRGGTMGWCSRADTSDTAVNSDTVYSSSTTQTTVVTSVGQRSRVPWFLILKSWILTIASPLKSSWARPWITNNLWSSCYNLWKPVLDIVSKISIWRNIDMLKYRYRHVKYRYVEILMFRYISYQTFCPPSPDISRVFYADTYLTKAQRCIPGTWYQISKWYRLVFVYRYHVELDPHCLCIIYRNRIGWFSFIGSISNSIPTVCDALTGAHVSPSPSPYHHHMIPAYYGGP